MAAFQARPGLSEALDEAVRARGMPFLGICVGMQLMASRGLEFGQTQGLDWIGGEVRRLETQNAGLENTGQGGVGLRRGVFKIPHMGWNDIDLVEHLTGHHPIFDGLGAEAPMYFTHSFAFFPDDPADIAAKVDHGGVFAAAVARGNMAGVQFHPEKSQAAGLRLLANFLDWRP